MPIQISKLKQETQDVMKIFEKLENMGHTMPANDLALRWKIFKNPSDIYEVVKERESQRGNSKKRLLDQMVAK